MEQKGQELRKSEVSRQSQVEENLCNLESVVDRIGNIVCECEDRLSKILRLPCPRESVPQKEVDLVPLANSMDIVVDRLCTIESNLQDILKRVEL